MRCGTSRVSATGVDAAAAVATSPCNESDATEGATGVSYNETVPEERPALLCAAVSATALLTVCESFCDYAHVPGLLSGLAEVLADTKHVAVEAREHAARALKNAAVNDQMREMLVGVGAIGAMVKACRVSDSLLLQEQAARALGNMAVHDANEQRVVDAGGTTALLALLASTDEPLLDAALGALANLVGHPEMRAIFVAEGGVRLLRLPMETGREVLYKQAGWILASLAVDPGLGKHVIRGRPHAPRSVRVVRLGAISGGGGMGTGQPVVSGGQRRTDGRGGRAPAPPRARGVAKRERRDASGLGSRQPRRPRQAEAAPLGPQRRCQTATPTARPRRRAHREG